MAEQVTPVRIWSQPGIKRDGTLMDGANYVDGQWVRWQRKQPRKIGGYRRITNLLDDAGRGMHVFDQNNYTYTHIGNATTLQQMRISPYGVVSSFADRTPATMIPDPNNLWQFDSIYDGGGTDVTLVAHVAPNAGDISSDTASTVMFGGITSTSILTPTLFPSVSGGVCVSSPYVWAYGSDGIAYWSPPNDPDGYGGSGSGSARLCSSKIVRAMPLRAGAGAGPTTLFWSLNSLERATFVGGSAVFNFDTISPTSSILSAASVIEYNGVYFWIGVDSFLMFNGVVRELPNDMNTNWFFDNLNYTYRSRVFAFKIPRYNEIWWCYPRGAATECTHAIIFNVREGVWYDTELPMGGRSCAQYAQVFKSPLMCGVDRDASAVSGGHRLWQHEFGVDAIDGTSVQAIESYYETSEMGLPLQTDGDEAGGSITNIACERIEPDFVQVGDMYVVVKSRANVRSQERVSDPAIFSAAPADGLPMQQQLVNIRQTGRYMRFRFGSNTQGGDYQAGKIMGFFQTSSGRVTS